VRANGGELALTQTSPPDQPERTVTGIWQRQEDTSSTYPQPVIVYPASNQERGGRWLTLPDPLDERSSPEHEQTLQQEAARHGVAPLALSNRDTRTALARLVHASDMLHQVSEVSHLPPATGLSPAADARLRKVAPLVRLGLHSVEELLAPGRLLPTEVIGALEPFVAELGMRLV
jgi:hypothetical protein